MTILHCFNQKGTAKVGKFTETISLCIHYDTLRLWKDNFRRYNITQSVYHFRLNFRFEFAIKSFTSFLKIVLCYIRQYSLLIPYTLHFAINYINNSWLVLSKKNTLKTVLVQNLRTKTILTSALSTQNLPETIVNSQ